MFVPILTDMFNHWFAQGDIPGSITKGMITLLKKGGRHVWEKLENYRSLTLLNIKLKILAWVLANHLQLVISNLIGPEENYAVKGRSIQDNLHLVSEILEGLKDGTKTTLINLDQSKAFNRVDCQIPTRVPQIDEHDVPQPIGGGTGEREVLRGIRNQKVSLAAPAPEA